MVVKMNGTLDRRHLIVAGALFAAMGSGAANAKAPRPFSITVYKDPSCGCCSAWVDRLTSAGFKTVVEERADMAELKRKLGVPDEMTSCHTGVVDGYVIEGHVPPADIKRLLTTRPKAKGLAVPGMPVNSPGMEVEGAPNDTYTVWLFKANGTGSTAFAHHGG
jgi:hypothetical protein